MIARYWITPGQTDAMGWQQTARERLLVPIVLPTSSALPGPEKASQARTAEFYRAMAVLAPLPTASWQVLPADN